MELISVECPGCGAVLPPRDVSDVVQCEYCKARFRAAQSRAAKTQAGIRLSPEQLARLLEEARQEARPPPVTRPPIPPVIQPWPQQPPGRRRRSGGGGLRLLGCFVFLIMIGSAGVVVYLTVPDVKKLIDEAPQKVKNIVEHGNPSGPPPVRMGWNDGAGPPATVMIDGEEAVVVRIQKYDDANQIFVQAWNSRRVERVWELGPLGPSSEAYSATYVAVFGDRVLVSDYQNGLRIVNATTGEQVSRVTVSDKVSYICTPPPDGKGGEVWLAVSDERHQLLDVAAASTRAAGQPEWCAKSFWVWRRQNEHGMRDEVELPEVPGFAVEWLAVDGDVAVAGGHKSPGTAVPRAVGLTPETWEVRWNVVVASRARSRVKARSNEWHALAEGRYFTHYAVGSEDNWVTALDARTGEQLWETRLRPIFAVDNIDGVTASSAFLYIGRTGALDVLDAVSGSILGTIGTPTYDDEM